jgi:hypothetical protein
MRVLEREYSETVMAPIAPTASTAPVSALRRNFPCLGVIMTARTAESESGPERKRYFDLVDNGL